MHYSKFATYTAATFLISTVAVTETVDAKDTFKGKRLTLIIASNEGGGTDRMGRLVGQYLEKHLPGRPKIVTRNMGSGGGKIRAANYLMSKAKPDGLTFMQSDATGVHPGTLRRKSARFDPTKFEFIGSVNRGGSILFMRKDAKARLTDKSKRPVIVAAISGTRSWQAMPMWGAEYLGWNVKWIPGYRGTGSMNKALRQGEIDMFATNNAYVINQLRKDNLIVLITQDGRFDGEKMVPRDSYKNTPTMHDLLKKAKISKLSWDSFNVMTAPSNIDKWMGLPPKTPKKFVDIYRKAYLAATGDPEFVKIARKQFSKELSIIPGATVAKMVNEIHSGAKAKVDFGEELRAKYGLTAFKKKKKKKKK